MSTLSGQTVVVIGGSSGMGYGVALASLQAQASKVIIASSSPEKVAGAVKRLNAEKGSAPGHVVGEVVDAKDFQAVERFFRDAGEIDHLAVTVGDGFPYVPGIKEADISALKGIFDLRYWGPLQAVKCARFKSGGSVTFTTGSGLVKPLKGFGLAIGVPGAVDAVTRGLAVDLAPIRVNNVAPGLVKTEMFDVFPPEIQAKWINSASEALLVKHVATPAEIAEAYLFLMKCGFITGETIHVNGGQALCDWKWPEL